MISQFYRVFVSSTFLDLKDARAAVNEALLESGHYPVSMEDQPGSWLPQPENLRRRLQRSDIVVILLGDSYGTRIEGDRWNRSFTEFEFDAAVELGLPIVPLLKRPANGGDPALLQFYGKLNTQGRAPKYWTDANELPTKVLTAIQQVRMDPEVTGCVPARGVVKTFLDPLDEVSLSEKLLDEYAHDVAHSAARTIERLEHVETRDPMRWEDYCDFVRDWLHPLTREACEIRAVCSQKPWDDPGCDLHQYFQMYYDLAERERNPCAVVRLFVEGEEWGSSSLQIEERSAWFHLHEHLRRERITPLVIRRPQYEALDPRLRKYGETSGFVLVIQDGKVQEREVISAMIHRDTSEGIHAALLDAAHDAGIFSFLLRIFGDLGKKAEEFKGP